MERYESGHPARGKKVIRYHQRSPYVPVARRRQNAARKVAALRKRGRDVDPVIIEGRSIAHTSWGQAWCDHLESHSDDEGRLPRGRTYVRNGSVVDLQIAPGEIVAIVSGSTIYNVRIVIKKLAKSRWQAWWRSAPGGSIRWSSCWEEGFPEG